MLMHQIAICMILLGIVCFALGRLTADYRIHNPKRVTHEAPEVSEPEENDERWWREIFDEWPEKR